MQPGEDTIYIQHDRGFNPQGDLDSTFNMRILFLSIEGFDHQGFIQHDNSNQGSRYTLSYQGVDD